MSGGITQLVAVGIQDKFLSGSPEVSFFRSSYKRYTHFAQNVERQLIQGNPTPNGVSLLRFEKKGDLLSDVYLTANDPNQTSNVNVNWSQIISKLELMIGGQIIDTQDITYMSNIDPITNTRAYSQRYVAANVNSCVFLPLKFFFCKDWQSAIPLVALQYHDVEIRITWANPNAWDQYVAWARFLYLDNDERDWFAKNSHDMLITQVTRVPITPVSTFEFALAQPVKYIAFESNNYNTVYTTGSTTTTGITLMNTTGVATGLPVSIPGYISSNTYITSMNGSNTINIGAGLTQSMPANTSIIVGSPISNTFTLSSTGSIVTATGAAAIAQLFTTQVQAGWQVLVSGTGATAAQLVLEYTVTSLTATTLTLAATGSPSFSSSSCQLNFIPSGSLFNSVAAVSSSVLNMTATGAAGTQTLTLSAGHGIGSTASSFQARLDGFTVSAGSLPSGNVFTMAYTSATVITGSVASLQLTGTGTVTILLNATGAAPILQTAATTTPINPAGETYLSVHAPSAVNGSMVGWNLVLPQVGFNAVTGVITGVQQSNPESLDGLFSPIAGDALISVQFPVGSTYGTTGITTTATATTSTALYIYPPTLVTEAAMTPSGSLGSANAANMQFRMQINGNDIGESRSLPHWVDINQYYLTPFGYYSLTAGTGLNGVIPVAIIPFCLDTAKTQPTGSINFSRIDTFRLICPSSTNFQLMSKLGSGSYFYAVNYNVLRIQNGMGAVMYSS